MRFHLFVFTGNDPRKGWRIPLNEIKYNEQRDEETGYGYFGARYMDHELMTMWLSVDPMADKYPGISPYAYCTWNPVKLVDPDGRDTTLYLNVNSGRATLHCDTKRTGFYIVQTDDVEESILYSGDKPYDNVSIDNSRTILSFKDAEVAYSIYNEMLERKVQFEWNLMYLNDGSAELVTSALPHTINMHADDYISGNVIKWRHYHPYDIDYLYWKPSEEDQVFAKRLGLCPAFLDFCGQTYDFSPIIKEYGIVRDGWISRYRDILNKEKPQIRQYCE